MPSPLRTLPGVDRLLREPAVARLIALHSRPTVLEAARELLSEWRDALQRGDRQPPAADTLTSHLVERVEAAARPLLRPVLNGTGVVIHTNLGRAPLSPEAITAMAQIGSGYANLEYDLEGGQRGSRHDLVTPPLCRLSGAEDALVVNNNAAALLLVLSCLALGREVLISRGQLVEIGGGFRIPDVLRESGSTLVEVGTTNRTYARDYEAASGADTALFLRVHSSNFRVIGFVHEPSLAELAEAAHQRGLLLVDDLGSGALVDTSTFGLAREPMVQDSIAQGADLVCFSGDKLLGGPQCGIIVGKRALIGRLKRHPLVRAIRPDKLTLAALGATLNHYLRGEAESRVPVLRMLAATPQTIEDRALGIATTLAASPVRCEVLDGSSAIGGGSLPGETLPTRLLALTTALSPDRLAAHLRRAQPPVVGRIEHGRFVLDLRTILPEEDELLATTLRAALAEPSLAETTEPGAC